MLHLQLRRGRRPSAYNGHRTIRMQELDFEQKKVVGEQTVLVNGGTDISKRPIWCEGPHLYKINGKYYLMAAQGGTSTNHSEVIFRSDSLRGPYVPWEKNPMITAQDVPGDGPGVVTCTGHADMVQTQNGEWFAVFLACQPYQKSFFNTGRQTFLLPVTWTDGWPSILPPKTPVPLTGKKPNLPSDKAPVPTTGDISFSEDFTADTLGLKWVGLRAPVGDWHATSYRTMEFPSDSQRISAGAAGDWHATSKSVKALFLAPKADRLSGLGNPAFLAVRQQNDIFTCSVKLSAQTRTTNCIAGLAAFQNEGHYYAINVKVDSGKLVEVALEQPSASGGRVGGGRGVAAPANILAVQKLPENLSSIELKIEGAGPVTKCYYKVGAGAFTPNRPRPPIFVPEH